MDPLARLTDNPQTTTLGPAIGRVRCHIDARRAPATRRAYTHDVADFTAWCTAHGFAALPAAPEAVALYLDELVQQKKKLATIARRLAAIRFAHRAAEEEDPVGRTLVVATWQGIRRTLGRQQTHKAALLTDALRGLLATLGTTRLIDLRDRALLLIGFVGAFRRSELVGLDVADVQPDEPHGIVLRLRRTKTDQEGQGRLVGIPRLAGETCPVAALEAWLKAAKITRGPLFRAVDRHGHVAPRRLHPYAVARIVQRAAAKAGLDAATFAGHSLRAGFLTSAARGGADEQRMMEQSGHRSIEVARRYIRRGKIWDEHPAYRVGL